MNMKSKVVLAWAAVAFAAKVFAAGATLTVPTDTSKPHAARMEWEMTARVTAAGKAPVRFEYNEGAHDLDTAWAALLEDGREISRDRHAGFTGSNPRTPVFVLDVPMPKAGIKYTLRAWVAGARGTDSHGNILWNFKPAT
jgi:hexosaminidase